MKRHFSRLLMIAVLLTLLPVRTLAAQYLVPVGQVIGLQLYNDTVTVAAYDDVLGGAAKAAGLKIGDRIVKINDTKITCAEDVRAALESGEGELNLTVSRGGKQRALTLTPTQTKDGPRMGVFLRQGIAGIGTVTWYDPDTGAFGALGHGGTGGIQGFLCLLTHGVQGRGVAVDLVQVWQHGVDGHLRSGGGSRVIGVNSHNIFLQGIYLVIPWVI